VKRTGKMAEKGTNRFFQAITSPHLLSFSQETIHSYLNKREAYLRQFKEAHDDNVKPATVLSSIDPDILENAVIMSVFLGENVDSVEKLTDDVVENYLTSAQNCDSFMSADKLLVGMKEKVRCNLNEPDPALRIIQMVSTYMTVLRKCRMATLYKDSPKLGTQHLVELVQPVGLQDILHSDRDLQHKDLTKNFSGWVKHIRERAVAYEIYNGSSAGKTSKKTSNAGPATKSGGGSGGGGGNGVSGGGGAGIGDSRSKSTSETSKNQMGKDKASDKKKASSEGSAKEPPSCLNKSKCAYQKHWMSNCPNSTEEEKKTLLDAYKASKASGGSLNSLINSIQSSAHLNVTIGDNSYVAIADTGATHSAIVRPIVESLRAAGVLIATKKLPRPMDLSLAISEVKQNRKQFQ
jgi:hypothetical protein